MVVCFLEKSIDNLWHFMVVQVKHESGPEVHHRITVEFEGGVVALVRHDVHQALHLTVMLSGDAECGYAQITVFLVVWAGETSHHINHLHRKLPGRLLKTKLLTRS
jgi:hypothetical protein